MAPSQVVLVSSGMAAGGSLGGGLAEECAWEDVERLSGAGGVLCESVGSYHTLSGLRPEPCNAAMLSSWGGGQRQRADVADGWSSNTEPRDGEASLCHQTDAGTSDGEGRDADELIRRFVRQVVARFAGDALLAGAGLWMEAGVCICGV